LCGGLSGQPGSNSGESKSLPSKTSYVAEAGERLMVQTPGGGGWGKVER